MTKANELLKLCEQEVEQGLVGTQRKAATVALQELETKKGDKLDDAELQSVADELNVSMESVKELYSSMGETK